MLILPGDVRRKDDEINVEKLLRLLPVVVFFFFWYLFLSIRTQNAK